MIHETAIVEEGAKIGNNTNIWHFCHVRKDSEIGNNCNVGKGCYIDVNVKIGSNVKIQNGISVYQGVEIEDNVFLGPHMVFTNDLYPRAFNTDWKIEKTLVKEGASIGANATIICNNKIGNYAMVGSGSVVTKDVPDYGLVVGNPAKLIGFVCKCGLKLDLTNIMEETTDYVVVNCDSCGETILLNKSDFELINSPTK
ncbi:acyltransferase [Methanococcus voltae]|uniref:Acetyltransferase-like isoleucine patch superfamily enzyme n=1 Tax=Methanococcus voltae PS TaxID=523842 RepID=A0ABT2EW85_METVO|nr:acyltransferase [Methanococcus voltae]MBP2172662.1 acetyltransferase-like isoleucine patch superfamily enzyme [Methanococcus voltae]MCS3922216.1 acetyltransferase-like isoleucine patch superfamily enzyme [Methanococcus voltae PS]